MIKKLLALPTAIVIGAIMVITLPIAWVMGTVEEKIRNIDDKKDI